MCHSRHIQSLFRVLFSCHITLVATKTPPSRSVSPCCPWCVCSFVCSQLLFYQSASSFKKKKRIIDLESTCPWQAASVVLHAVFCVNSAKKNQHGILKHVYSWGTHEGLGSAISSTAVHLCLLHLSRKKTHSEIAPPRPSSQPQLTRLPLVFLRPLIFNTSPCVSARGSKHNKSQNPKLFFFMLYIRFVCSEHPAAGRGETVSTADIEGSVGNWIEDIGQWPPTYWWRCILYG